MFPRRAVLAVIAVCTVLASGTALAKGPRFAPGAPGAGDAYFPLDGNGGYDVDHYLLEVRYDPATDRLNGRASITAHATQDLSQFNFDLDGLYVESITVDGCSASWSRQDGELTVVPAHGLRDKARFVVVIDYRGVPEPPPGEALLGTSGFIHTDDGAIVVGQPHVAATWFPANDHPADRAAFTFKVTVPEGLEVVANGALVGQRSRRGWTTWVWDAKDQMATYLAGMVIGELNISSYQHSGIRYWDAIDPDLFTPIEPVTGSGFALSQQASSSYKRLSRVLSIPAEGAELSFWVTRDTEQSWDFFFVEAHTVGVDDWTTLPDVQGVATQDVGFVCPYWHQIHPFLEHYQTAPGTELESCAATGDTGEWWAVSGASNGAEQWTVDLSAWAGTQVEVALSYASDDVFQIRGVFVDDIVVSTGEGSTSFEDDGDVLDGWTVPGPPEGSPGNQNDWMVGTAADAPATPGEMISASLARQPEIISFLEENFGKYPFHLAGGIVDDGNIGFALENQTRPIYDKAFFSDSASGDSVIVHELTHQWFGDSLTLQAWQDIWLNEGFATYAEWLWSEHEGLASTQEMFDSWYAIDAESPFWTVVIGDPGPDLLFDGAVYGRGAMTLHELRRTVGDETFFRILRRWARSQAGGTVTTDEFIELAERIANQQLDELFDVWLFAPAKPDLETAGLRRAQADTAAAAAVSPLRQQAPVPMRAGKLLRK